MIMERYAQVCDWHLLQTFLFHGTTWLIKPVGWETHLCTSLPRINDSFLQFVNSWNHHPIHTAHNKSPHQLFSIGLLILWNSGLTTLDPLKCWFYLWYRRWCTSPHSANTIDIPECTYQISDTNMTSLKLAIDPLQQSSEYGIV